MAWFKDDDGQRLDIGFTEIGLRHRIRNAGMARWIHGQYRRKKADCHQADNQDNGRVNPDVRAAIPPPVIPQPYRAQEGHQ